VIVVNIVMERNVYRRDDENTVAVSYDNRDDMVARMTMMMMVMVDHLLLHYQILSHFSVDDDDDDDAYCIISLTLLLKQGKIHRC